MKDRGDNHREENNTWSLQNYHMHKHMPEYWARRTAAAIRRRSRKNNIPFNLVSDDLLNAIPISGLCPILGLKLTFGGKKMSPSGASVDRFVPSLGYIRGNFSIISWRANLLKRDVIDPTELEKVAAYIRAIKKP
jgi:hypothetical protein